MGKQTKNRRFRPSKAGPLGDISGFECPKNDQAAASKTVEKLVESLRSPNTETQICACASIASFAEELYPQFLEAQVVKLVGPFLIDKNATLRSTSLGALRNLSLCGDSVAVCSELIKQDVMTPLDALLQKMNDTYLATDSCPEKSDLEVLEQAVHLVWNLCESSDLAVEIFNRLQFGPVLLQIFNSKWCSLALKTVVAQCVLTVAEENDTLLKMLRMPQSYEFILNSFRDAKLENKDEFLLKVTLAGLLCLVSEAGGTDTTNCVIADVLPVLSTVIQLQLSSYLQELAHAVQKLQNSSAPSLNMVAEQAVDAIDTDSGAENGAEDTECCGEEMTEEAVDRVGESATPSGNQHTQAAGGTPAERQMLEKQLEVKIAEIKCLKQAQQTALEILANLTCPQDESGEWEDAGESSDASADEPAMDMEAAAQQQTEEQLEVNADVAKAILRLNIIDNVLAICTREFEPALVTELEQNQDTVDLINSLSGMRCSALLCLSNLVVVLSEDTLEGSTSNGATSALYKIWTQLGSLLNASVSGAAADPQVAEASSSALRAVLNKLADFAPEKLSAVSEADLQFLCSAQLACDTPQTRVNLLRIVACIGDVLAEQQPPHPHFKGICEFFCEVCRHEQEFWVLAECQDCIFDVFSEDTIIFFKKFNKSSISSVFASFTVRCAVASRNSGVVFNMTDFARGICEFFCEVCCREQELWVVAECLDCIFDVFGEDHLNGILRDVGLLEILKNLLPTLKSKYQQQRATLGEHLPVVNTAKTNLPRFIKYKMKVMT